MRAVLKLSSSVWGRINNSRSGHMSFKRYNSLLVQSQADESAFRVSLCHIETV